jgi:hypothetical protein
MPRGNRQKTGALHTGKKSASQIVWRIAVYIRLSREDGNNESESVVNQKKILTEYLDKFFEGEYEVVDFYIDDGLTGTDDTRANFMRLIHDIDQGKVNCMICKTLSRAFRNYSDQGYYLEYYFPQQSVRFICTGDPKIDTFTNPEAITGLEVPITGLMNDRFAAQTSNAVRRTFATKRRNGEYIGAFAPYGYLKDPNDKNRLILDPDIVPIKKDIYCWIVNDGMSLNGVAKKLNELGIPNPTAYKQSLGWKYNNPNTKDNDGLWTGSTVRRMLLAKVNLGHMEQGKQRVVSYKVHDKVAVPEDEWFFKENTHEPTFTQEEYGTLERLLLRDTRTANDKRTVYLFSGFMKCADCGKALQRKPAGEYLYYVCRTYTEKSKTRCTRHTIRESILKQLVFEAVKEQVLLVESLASLVDEINNAPTVDTQSKRIEKMLKEKRRELSKTKALSDGLYVDWKSGDITREDYRRMKDRFEEQINGLIETIAHLEEEQRLMGQGVNTESSLFTAFLKYKNIQELDRSILIELVDKIYVHEGKKITIDFRYADDMRRILEFIDINTSKADMA